MTQAKQLSALQAFDAMRNFLNDYWQRGGKSSSDIAGLLGALNRGMMADGSSPDPALWTDWLRAVAQVSELP